MGKLQVLGWKAGFLSTMASLWDSASILLVKLQECSTLKQIEIEWNKIGNNEILFLTINFDINTLIGAISWFKSGLCSVCLHLVVTLQTAKRSEIGYGQRKTGDYDM